MRFLGIKVQGGLSSEANVFATLLGNRGGAYEARVVYHQWGEGDGLDKFRTRSRADIVPMDLGLRPASVNESRAAKLRAMLEYRLRYRRVIAAARAYRPDVVYSSQQLWDSSLSRAVARALNIPQVVHLHFNVGPWLSHGFSPTPRLLNTVRTALRMTDPLDTLRTCEHVVTVSDFLRKQVMEFGVPGSRVTTVHNAARAHEPAADARTRIRASLGLAEDAIVIANVGTLLASKGQVETLQAFTRISEKYPKACFVIVGDGPERARLESMVQEHRLGARVKLTGQRSDVSDLLAAADVFAHPSQRDPFPLAVLEGLAAGLPVLAWADGGVREQVVHGETGFLVPTSDVNALTDAMSSLLGDAALRERMGQNAIRHVATHCNPAQIAGSFTSLMQRVAGRG